MSQSPQTAQSESSNDRQDELETLGYLWRVCNHYATIDLGLAAQAGKRILSLASEGDIRLSRPIYSRLCNKCGCPMLPGLSSRVRNRQESSFRRRGSGADAIFRVDMFDARRKTMEALSMPTRTSMIQSCVLCGSALSFLGAKRMLTQRKAADHVKSMRIRAPAYSADTSPLKPGTVNKASKHRRQDLRVAAIAGGGLSKSAPTTPQRKIDFLGLGTPGMTAAVSTVDQSSSSTGSKKKKKKKSSLRSEVGPGSKSSTPSSSGFSFLRR
eukprot:Clim_evm43s147 gene=Clim_evmTU43s147